MEQLSLKEKTPHFPGSTPHGITASGRSRAKNTLALTGVLGAALSGCALDAPHRKSIEDPLSIQRTELKDTVEQRKEKNELTGYFRLGVQGIATTATTSETGHSAQQSINLPKIGNNEFLDAPSLQFNQALVNANGFNVGAQITEGVTWRPKKFFNANASLAIGFDNYFTGLDKKETHDYNFAGYALPSVSLNFSFLHKDNTPGNLTFSPFATSKIYFNEFKFKGEDHWRSPIQAAAGLNIAYTHPKFEMGSNAAFYPTDWGFQKEGRATFWGEALYVKIPF